jgi:hypothetical protein
MITGKMEKLNTRIATLSMHPPPRQTLSPSSVGVGPPLLLERMITQAVKANYPRPARSRSSCRSG